MLFEEDDIKRQRGAMARGEYVDPDPLPEDLEIPDGLLLVSDRQRMAEVYCALLRSCDFGEPDEEAELLRTLDLFAVINREQFYEFLEAMAAEQFSGELTPWIDEGDDGDPEPRQISTDGEQSS